VSSQSNIINVCSAEKLTSFSPTSIIDPSSLNSDSESLRSIEQESSASVASVDVLVSSLWQVTLFASCASILYFNLAMFWKRLQWNKMGKKTNLEVLRSGSNLADFLSAEILHAILN